MSETGFECGTIEAWLEKKLKDAGLWVDDCLQTSLELFIERRREE